MEPQAPTRLERVVDVLAKLTLVLWGGGFAVLIVNSALVHQHVVSLIGVRTLLAGCLVAFVIIVAVMSSMAVGRVRAALNKQD